MISSAQRRRTVAMRRGAVVFVVCCLVLLVLPYVVPFYAQGVLAKVWILAIFAMSLDLLLGYTGLLSLGHAAFLGVGGYAVGMAVVRYDVDNFWAAIGLAVLLAALVGALFGIVALRVRGAQFLLVTFALAELLVALARKWSFLSPGGYGSQGVTGILRPTVAPMTQPLSSVGMYYVAAAALVLSYLVMRQFLRTPLGLTLPAVREQELRTRALGYQPIAPMYVVYVLAAAFAGLAGALLAYHDGIVTPTTFGVGQSTIVLLMVLIGGAGRLYGAVIGAAVIYLAQYYASTYFTDRWPLILGGIFVAAVLFARGGIVGLVAAGWSRRRRWTRPRRPRHSGEVQDGRPPDSAAADDATGADGDELAPGDATGADGDELAPDAPDAPELLTVQGVSRRFGGITALDDVSLTVRGGERLAIIGTNGAGKTTLFNLIAGTLPLTHGRIEFDGHDVTSLPAHRRAQLGIGRTFQTNTLFPELTVADSVWLACQGATSWRYQALRSARRRRAARSDMDRLLDRWDLKQARDSRTRDLAYGEQRRLEIALGVASSPQLLLMDEPTAGQSLADSQALAAHILAMPRTVTIIVIAHDLDLVFTIADRIAVMHRGRIVAVGTPGEIAANDSVQAIYTGLVPDGDDRP